MIPKVIHCCWLGGKRTKLADKCRASWSKFAPGWEIREWNRESLDEMGEGVPMFVRSAIESQKWAFAADWVRFVALEREGGVYFDSDVELVGPIDELAVQGEFVSGEYRADGSVGIGASVVGLEKGSAVAREMLAHYEQSDFSDQLTVGEIMMGRGLGVRVLDPEVFSPIDCRGVCHRTERTLGIHHYAMSWATPARRIARWLSWHGMRGLVELALRLKGVRK